MFVRSSSRQLVIVCILLTVAISGLFFLDRASANSDLVLMDPPGKVDSNTVSYTAMIGELAYVQMGEVNSLALIDTQTHTTIGSLDLAPYGCDYPERVRLNPDGTELYVACEYSHNIIVLDTTDLSLIATIDGPTTCQQDVAFVRSGAYALASSGSCWSGQIDVIDTVTHTIVQTISTGNFGIININIHPFLPLAYAAGSGVGVGYIYVIDTNTFSIQATIPVGYTVIDVQPSPDGKWLYASDYDLGILKIDVATNFIVDTSYPVGCPCVLDISPDGSILYASDRENSIYIIDTEVMEMITNVEVGVTNYEIELTCDGSELYVSSMSTSVPVIDTQTYNISYDIPIPGASGFGIAICPPSPRLGAFLNPPTQSKFVEAGETITYTLQMVNMTGETDSFDLQVLPGNSWTTTLSTAQVGPMADGESVTFTARVEVPPSAQPAISDTVTLLATSATSPTVYTSTATLTTLTPAEEMAYVPMSDIDGLALIDTQTHTTIGSINLASNGCNFPKRAMLTPDGTELYVTCDESDNMIVLQTTDLSLVAAIDRPGTCSQDVTFVQAGAYALASTNDCEGLYQIDVIDTATYTIVQSISTLNHRIESLAAHPFLPLAYAAGISDEGQGSILIINTNTFSIQNEILAENVVVDVQPSNDGQWLYASVLGTGVVKIDLSNNVIVDTFSQYYVYGLDILPDGSTLYVAEGIYSAVTMIDTDSMQSIGGLYVGDDNYDNELTCDGSELYVALQTGSVPVFDTQTYDMPYIIPIPSAGSGYGIAICPQYLAQVAYLNPPSQSEFADAGETIAYTLEMFNLTGETDSFDLQALPGNTWTTTLSIAQVGPIADGESITFTAWVEVPPSGLPGDQDAAIIQATSVNSPTVYTSTASLNSYIPGEEMAYVTLGEGNQVAVVDVTSQVVVETIDTSTAGCNYPQAATLSPNGAYVYIGCGVSGSVLVIETESNSVVTNVSGIPSADDIAFTQSGNHALVGSRDEYQIAVIDTETFTVIQTIPTNGNPRNLAMHPYLNRAYAASSSGEILVIDTYTFTIVDSIDVSGEPWDVAISPNGAWVFADDRWGNGLWVIDANTNTLYTTVSSLGYLYGLEVSNNGAYIYVGGQYGGVWIIDGNNFEPITQVMIDDTVWELALTCDDSQLYVGNDSNEVAVIDTSSFSVSGYIPMHNIGSLGIAICPDYIDSQVILEPAEQTNPGAPGQIVEHVVTLVNATGFTDTFSLSLGAYAWETSLSSEVIGPLPHGGTDSFSIYMSVPPEADWYDSDTVVVTADSLGSPGVYTDTAQVTTVSYVPPQISVDPSSLESTQLPGEVTSQTLTISNGEGVTLTYDIFEEGTYPGKVASLGMNEPPGSTAYFDQSGYGNHATCSGEACPTAGVPGAFGTALSFDGIDDHIEIAHNPEFDAIEDQDNLSIATWVWIDNWDSNSSFMILDQGMDWAGWSFEVGAYQMLFYSYFMQTLGCSYNFNTQEWYHVVFSYDPSLNEVHFYVNGSLICDYTSDYFDIWDTQDEPMFIGYAAYGDVYANGKIDELNIFNRAISAEEVTALYQGGLGGEVPWLSVDPTSGSLPTGGSAPVQVTFDATSLQPGIYTTTLYINSNDPLQPLLAVPVTLTVVGLPAGVEITPAEAGLSGPPGETVAYTFTLTNLGTLSDSFSLEESSIWTTTLSADTTGELGPGESFTFTVSVIIPSEAEDGAQDVAFITATSANDPGVSASAQATTIAVVEPQAGVDITPTEASLSGSPGETVAYTFTLTNLGNVADSFTLEVTSTWTATLPVTATGELGVGETFIFVTYVTIPLEAQDGDQDVAVIKATSANDPLVSAGAQATTSAVISTYQVCLPLVAKN